MPRNALNAVHPGKIKKPTTAPGRRRSLSSGVSGNNNECSNLATALTAAIQYT